ncbi:isocitrate/isopropylmalate dehydrogenase family protein [Pelagibacterium montanilacus]|uniref:isocitrate/isopropylmalate dehydrogenase family protein n=1 Tax=Pelagibacterium montanilacus TaxID=2185280 RepID=UPI001FEA533E|nr:isocitrate/isopropylmalate family dehydrogenase [Pelagibacterium montanilacus]
MSKTRFDIAVLGGDGIGPEVLRSSLDIIDEAARLAGGFSLDYTWLEAGGGCYQRTGEAFPGESRAAAHAADAVLVGAMGVPGVTHPDGTEIAPQLELRFDLDLYAGLRPIRSIPGVPSVLADSRANSIDIMIVRESTEGLFDSAGKGTVTDDTAARDWLTVTRHTSERLFDRCFELAQARAGSEGKGKVTCVDKANLFTALAFFRKIFDERAARFTDIQADHVYVDAMAQRLVLEPWAFDVMVMENMFGDILGDLGVALIGGANYAPSANIGDRHGVFQPCHGSSTGHAGTGKANPTAMILSGAMMLDWIGLGHGMAAPRAAANAIVGAVDSAFASGNLTPFDQGGRDGLDAIAQAIGSHLR